jgi:hypothetical protein
MIFGLVAPVPVLKECRSAALQFHDSEMVTAVVNSDEPGRPSAAVPFGPSRSYETIASQPYGKPAGRLIPTACADHARESHTKFKELPEVPQLIRDPETKFAERLPV